MWQIIVATMEMEPVVQASTSVILALYLTYFLTNLTYYGNLCKATIDKGL